MSTTKRILNPDKTKFILFSSNVNFKVSVLRPGQQPGLYRDRPSELPHVVFGSKIQMDKLKACSPI